MITFEEPNGNVIKSPSPNLLQEIILCKGKEYWELGSGEASLDFVDAHLKSFLILIFSYSSNEYYIEYYPRQRETNPYLPVSDLSKEGGYFEVIVSGELYRLPSIAFVSRKKASEIIEVFAKTGMMCRNTIWKRKSDFDWPDDKEN